MLKEQELDNAVWLVLCMPWCFIVSLLCFRAECSASQCLLSQKVTSGTKFGHLAISDSHFAKIQNILGQVYFGPNEIVNMCHTTGPFAAGTQLITTGISAGIGGIAIAM
jgi:hypothetical protein